MVLFLARLHDVTQIRAMKAGDVFVRFAQLKLFENVMPDTSRSASGESGDRLIGKVLAQRAELPVFGPEFVSPFGDAVRLVNCEKSQRNTAKPGDRILPGQALGREVEQTESALRCGPHHFALIFG